MSPTKEWFEEKVEKIPGAGCWIWLGSMTSTGYGRWHAKPKDKNIKAHRLAYTLFVGPVADDIGVCHRCDVPLCVNPAHLFLGDQKANMGDAARKRRTAAGDRHGRKKLNAEQAAEIRKSTDTAKQLMRLYGISHAQVLRIRRGVNW
jgi:hypothetical protein